MCRHIEVNGVTSLMGQDDENKQQKLTVRTTRKSIATNCPACSQETCATFVTAAFVDAPCTCLLMLERSEFPVSAIHRESGALPQSGFALLICRMSSRISGRTQGLPDFPALPFQLQYHRKPFRCHPITVSGLTMTSAVRHCAHSRESMTQSKRSAVLRLGRLFVRRCNT